MTATAFTCEAPTDAQLAKLAEICDERGIAPLPVVYSRGDASACITAILRREYEPAAWGAARIRPRPRRRGRAVLIRDGENHDARYEDVPAVRWPFDYVCPVHGSPPHGLQACDRCDRGLVAPEPEPVAAINSVPLLRVPA